MTETEGHFEQGRWVDNPAPVPETDTGRIDARITAATGDVIAALENAAAVTRDLVASEEGKRYIEKTMKDTTAEVRSTFDGILARARTELDSRINPPR
jgi:hypothetical protein